MFWNVMTWNLTYKASIKLHKDQKYKILDDENEHPGLQTADIGLTSV